MTISFYFLLHCECNISCEASVWHPHVQERESDGQYWGQQAISTQLQILWLAISNSLFSGWNRELFASGCKMGLLWRHAKISEMTDWRGSFPSQRRRWRREIEERAMECVTLQLSIASLWKKLLARFGGVILHSYSCNVL